MLRHAKDGGQGTACQSLSCPKQITTDGQGKTVAAAKEVATNCDGEKVAFAPKDEKCGQCAPAHVTRLRVVCVCGELT